MCRKNVASTTPDRNRGPSASELNSYSVQNDAMASILDSVYKDNLNTMNFELEKINIIFLGTTWKVYSLEDLWQIYGLVLNLAWKKGHNYGFEDFEKS